MDNTFLNLFSRENKNMSKTPNVFSNLYKNWIFDKCVLHMDSVGDKTTEDDLVLQLSKILKKYKIERKY